MMYGYGGSIMGDGGYAIVMALFWLMFVLGVVLLVLWLVRRSGGQMPNMMHHMPMMPGDNACTIARERYAKGEITKDQYDEICATLAAR